MKNGTSSTNAATETLIADALLRASAPLLVLGYGAVVSEATLEVEDLLAELPHARVAATPKAKGIIAETHDRYLGVIGFAGHAVATNYLFEVADFVLVIGSRLGELTSDNWDVRWHDVVRAQIDIRSEVFAELWCPPLHAVGDDAKATLRRLLAYLRSQPQRAFPALPIATRTPRCSVQACSSISPPQVFEAIDRHFPGEAHVFCGIGNSMAWGVHYLQRTRSNRWHVNLAAGAMGHAIPAAMGACFAGGPSLAVVGDAEFLMTGHELHTAVENELPVVVLVLNDAGHGMVRAGTRVHCQGRTPSFDFTRPVDVVAAAGAEGAVALRCADSAHLQTALIAALTRSGPTIIDIPISRDIAPPLGSRLDSLSQAFGLSRSVPDVG